MNCRTPPLLLTLLETSHHLGRLKTIEHKQFKFIIHFQRAAFRRRDGDRLLRNLGFWRRAQREKTISNQILLIIISPEVELFEWSFIEAAFI